MAVLSLGVVAAPASAETGRRKCRALDRATDVAATLEVRASNEAAQRLYANGLKGVDPARQVAVKIAERAKDFSAKFPTIAVSKDIGGGAISYVVYALVGAAAAIAAAVGPLLGGFITTYLSWRIAFLMEDLIIVIVLVNIKLVRDVPYTGPRQIDGTGAVLSVWDAVYNYTWMPINIHRIIANVARQPYKDMVAQMVTEIEATRLLVYRAAWQKDQGQLGNSLEVAQAKYLAGAPEAAGRLLLTAEAGPLAIST